MFGASRLFADLPVSVDLERDWIEMLFGLSLFTDRRGLYCPGTLGRITYGGLGFSLDPLRKGVSLAGLRIEFQGLAFNLFLRPVFGPYQSALDDIQLFRPAALHVSNSSREGAHVVLGLAGRQPFNSYPRAPSRDQARRGCIARPPRA